MYRKTRIFSQLKCAKKIHHFFSLIVFLVVCASGSAHAAGYTCSSYKKYTSCNSGYYVSDCGTKRDGSTVTASVGNSCTACPSNHTCSGGLVCPKPSTVTCSAGYYKNASDGCTSCEAGYYCPGGTWSKSTSIAGRNSCTNTKNANAEYYGTGTTSNACPIRCKANYYGNGTTCTACSTVSFSDTGSCTRTASITGGSQSYTGGSQTRTCYRTTSTAGSTAASSCTGSASCGSYNACSGGTLSTVTCNAGYYKNTSNTCTACEAGYYCPGGTWTQSTSIQGRSSCTNTKNANAEYYGTGTTSNACPIRCKANYYGNGTTCTACNVSFTDTRTGTCTRSESITGGTKNYTGGTDSRTCYHTTSTAGSTASSSCTGTANCTAYGSCSSGTLSTVTCNAGYYKNTSNTCTACEAGYYCPGGTWTQSTSIQGRNSCAAGTYTSTTGQSTCAACPKGKYCTGGSNLTNCAAGTYRSTTGAKAAGDCSACTGRNSYSAAGAESCTTVSSGYYSTGCNTSNNNCTGQSACGDNAYYCSGGVRNSVSSGYYSTGGDANTRTGQSACGGNAYYCSGGVRNSVSSGYYSTGGTETTRTGQSQCTGTTYCSGGVSYSCPDPNTNKRTTFPANYYNPVLSSTSVQSANGRSAITQCQALSWYNPGDRVGLYEYVNYNSSSGKYDTVSSWAYDQVKAGYYLTTKAGCGSYAYYTEVKECPANSYCPGKGLVACNSSNSATVHTTNFGLESCPSGYSSAAKATAKSSCTISCSAGTRVASADATCTTPAGSWYTGAHTVAAGSTSSVSSCVNSNYTTPNTATTTDHDNANDCKASCAAGTRVTAANGACTAITSGNIYTLAHSVVQGGTTTVSNCPNGYTISGTTQTDHDAKADCKISCAAGTQVATADAACTTPTGSWYTAAHTVSAGSKSSPSSCVNTNYTTPNTATATDHDNVNDCKTSCAAGTRVTAANGACTAITSGNIYTLAHSVVQGGTTTVSNCPNGYTISGTTQTDHDAKADCKISCAAGTQVATADAACTTPTGSWYTAAHTVSAGSKSSPSSCNTGYATPSTTTATNHDNVNDCAITCSAGYYIATAGAGCAACPAGKYCTGGTKNQTETLTATGNCPAGTYSNGGATSNTCTAAITGKTAAVCATNTYSAAGASSCTNCPTGYSNSGTTAAAHADAASCKITVSGGHYISASGQNSTNWQTCAAGTAKGQHTVAYGSTSSCDDCTDGTYSTAGGSSCSNCNALNAAYTKSDGNRNAASTCYLTTESTKYVATANAAQVTCAAGGYCPGSVKIYYGSTGGRTACSAGTYNASSGASAASACTACQTGSYQNATGQTACKPCDAGKTNTGTGNTAACTTACTAIANISTWATTTWSNGTVSNLCTVASCAANSYKSGNTCPTCSSGTSSKYTLSAAGSTSVGQCYLNLTSGNQVASAGAGSSACTAGRACSSTAKIYYNTTGGTAVYTGDECQGRTKYSGAGASSCSTVSSGYYTTGCNTSNNNCTGQSACGGNAYYCSGGVRNSVSSGYYSTGGTETTRTGQSQCEAGNYCSGGVKTACSEGTKYAPYNGQTSCSNISDGYYKVSNSSQEQCPANYRIGGPASTINGCQTYCSGSNYVAANNAACTSVGTGYWSTGHYVNYGSTSTRNQCPAGYRDGAAASAESGCTASCADGQYVAAKNAACSAVGGGYYRAAHTITYGNTDTRSQCPAGYPNSDAGADAITTCYSNSKSRAWTGSPVNGATPPTNCASVTEWNTCSIDACAYTAYSNSAGTGDGTIKTGCSTNSNNCTKTPKTVTASANSYVDGPVCKTCSSLAGGLYPNSAAGNTGGAGVCKTNNLVGQYIATKNASSATNCGAGKYKAAHQVAYGSTSSCDTASAGYFAAGPTSANQTQCAIGSYSDDDGAAECTACGDGGDFGKTTTAAGQTSCNATCANADGVKGWENTKWNSNNTVSNLCVPNACDAGNYMDGTTCPSCDSFANGLYPHSATHGSNIGKESCFVRLFEINGSYIAKAEDEEATECPAGSYSSYTNTDADFGKVVHYGETSSCATCPANTYATGTGNTQCTACLENYTSYGPKTSEASCRISCPGGTYLKNARDTECTHVGIGNWAAQSYVPQGERGTVNACPSGLTTIGYGTGADEAADCGHVMNIGNTKLYLRADKKTTPALNVKVGDQTFYGNMSTESKNMSANVNKSLKVKLNNTTYSVYDDSGENWVNGGGNDVTISPNLGASSYVPAAYNTAAGEKIWSATLSDGTAVSGNALCSATTAANGDISDAGFIPEGSGTGCWCQIALPAQGTKWVYATTNASCTDKCGYYCANNMSGTKAKNITYRTNLYTTAGINVQ